MARQVSTARLVEEADYDLTLVFEQASIASVHTKAMLSFITFQGMGTVALGAAGLLLSVATHMSAVSKTADVTSGQVNFGCEQRLQVDTPPILLGKNSRDIKSALKWINTDNVKSQNQEVVNSEDPVDHQVTSVKGTGVIFGLDRDLLDCRGGGHGELTLHVAWTEEE